MLTPSELAVLSYLVRCSDDTGICYPSIHTIAQCQTIQYASVCENLRTERLSQSPAAFVRANSARSRTLLLYMNSTRVFTTKVLQEQILWIILQRETLNLKKSMQ